MEISEKLSAEMAEHKHTKRQLRDAVVELTKLRSMFKQQQRMLQDKDEEIARLKAMLRERR